MKVQVFVFVEERYKQTHTHTYIVTFETDCLYERRDVRV